VRDDPEAVYGDLLPILRRADLRIVNCECALTRASKAAWKSGAVFKGEPAHAGGLTAVPFDVACLANNHVLDYGVAGLRETLRVFERNRIYSVGAGLTEEAAQETIRGLGLMTSYVNYQRPQEIPQGERWRLDQVKPGCVLSQTPAPGKTVDPGTVVYLAVRSR